METGRMDAASPTITCLRFSVHFPEAKSLLLSLVIILLVDYFLSFYCLS